MRVVTKKGKALQHVVCTFDGLAELTDWLEKTPTDKTGNDLASQAHHGDKVWDFELGYKGSLDLINNGWEKGAQEIEKLRNKQVGDIANGYAEVSQPEWNRDVAGDAVDVGAFLSGEPECMLVREEEEVNVPVVEIWFRLGCPANVEGKQLMNQGVAMLAAIDKIEAQGIRVKLVAWYQGWGRHRRTVKDRRFHFSCVVKRADEPLHLHTLAFAIAHPAFFRRLVFAVIERQGDKDQTGAFTDGGYGGIEQRIDQIPNAIPQDVMVVNPNWDATIETSYRKTVQDIQRKAAA